MRFNVHGRTVSLEAECQAEELQLADVLRQVVSAGGYADKWDDMHGSSGIHFNLQAMPPNPYTRAAEGER